MRETSGNSVHPTTDIVLATLSGCADARLKEIMTALIKHVHAFAEEVQLTGDEWRRGIEFLTQTGKQCDGIRQEFILLSDTLGVSMLVDAINHRYATGATDTTVFGPFYIEGMPERAYGENMAFTPGTPALVQGRVLSTSGEPVANALLDVWQTAENGMYSGQDTEQPHGNLRGRYHTDAEGRYAIRTIVPVCYPIPSDGPVGRMLAATGRHPWRPAHLHFMITAPGHSTLVTHLFNQHDPYLDSDAVFGVKPSLQVDYCERAADDAKARRFGFESGFREACYDFVLERA